jgi:hypothetical protein
MIWVAGRSPTLVSQNLKATTLTYLAISSEINATKLKLDALHTNLSFTSVAFISAMSLLFLEMTPPLPAVLKAMMLLRIVPPLLVQIPPPLKLAVLPDTVALVRVTSLSE